MGYIHIDRTYFDTGYIPESNTKIEAKFKVYTGGATNSGVFGEGTTYNSRNSFSLIYSTSRRNLTYYIAGQYNDYAYALPYEKEAIVTLSPSEFKITVDGETYTTPIDGNYEKSTYNLAIGTWNEANNLTKNLSNIDLYYLKIFEGDTLVYDFAPAINNDGYGCLKDKLTGNKYDFNDPTKVTAYNIFTVEADKTDFEHTGGTTDITITSENSWTATTDVDWISLSSYSGSGDDTIVATINAQSDGNYERTGVITFTDGDNSDEIEIYQDEYPVLIPIGKIYYNNMKIE